MMLKHILIAVAIAIVDASPLEKRQGFLGGMAGLFGFKAKSPVSTKKIEPQYNKDAIREIIRWGPYTLLGKNAPRPKGGFRLDPGGNNVNEMLDGLCKDCMILSGSTYLTYENESMADVGTGVYNHHVFVGDMSKSTKNYFACGKGGSLPPGTTLSTPGMSKPKGSGGSANSMGGMAGMNHGASRRAIPMTKRQSTPIAQIFGSGDDGSATTYAVKGADNKIGFYISPKDLIMSTSEFINYRDEEQKVYITFDVEYMKGKPPGWRDAGMSAMGATGCTSIAFNPPSDKAATLKSPAYTAQYDGTLFNAKAHLHDGGVNVKLVINGKLACDSQAHYGGDKGTTSVGGEKWETIQSYDFCPPIDVKKGDQVVVESTYDIPNHRLRPGAVDHAMGAEAMALMGYVFSEKV